MLHSLIITWEIQAVWLMKLTPHSYLQVTDNSNLIVSSKILPEKLWKLFLFKLCLSWEKFSVIPVNGTLLFEHYFSYLFKLPKGSNKTNFFCNEISFIIVQIGAIQAHDLENCHLLNHKKSFLITGVSLKYFSGCM